MNKCTCQSCNKSRGLIIKEWSGVYVRKDGTRSHVKRQLCESCYEKQDALRK
jgi:hypothetical protein